MLKNTKVESIDGVKHCVYCGSVAMHEFEYEDHYYRYDYYFCDCEGALLDIQVKEMTEKLNNLIKDTNEKILNGHRYEYELKQLKNKYKIGGQL